MKRIVPRRCWLVLLLGSLLSTGFYLLTTSRYAKIGQTKLKNMVIRADVHNGSHAAHSEPNLAEVITSVENNGNDQQDNGGDQQDNGGDQQDNGGDQQDNGGDQQDNGGDQQDNGGDQQDNGGDQQDNGGDQQDNGGDQQDNGDDQQDNDEPEHNGVNKPENTGTDDLEDNSVDEPMTLAIAGTTTGHLSPTDVAGRFQRRREILRAACKTHNISALLHPYHNPIKRYTLFGYSPAVKVRAEFCPITKTASTTWLGIVRASKRRLKVKAANKTGQPARKEKKVKRKVKFMFVREPYSRLLSAYVDKLLSPNTAFWAGTGKYVVQKFRPNASRRSLQCGHNVTFPEFIRYFIHSQKSLVHRDGHFVPAHDYCDVCNDYSYIGHLETLGEDVPFLLNVFQQPANLFAKGFDNGSIISDAGWVLKKMRKRIRKCMTMYEACLRLWKKWHIRGIISKTEPLPVTAEEAETISMEDFVSLAIKALNRSGSKEERKRQKTEALREAFASIPPEDRAQVQSMLALDFALFGFDSTPEAVFPSVPVKQVDSYSYFDLSQARSLG